MHHRIITFVNAPDICPSGYYRILQFFDAGSITIHSQMTYSGFRRWHKKSPAQKRAAAPFHFLTIIVRTLCSLLWECLRARRGDIIIVNRNICPRLLPPTHALLLNILAKRTTIIWDFDDNLIDQGIIDRREYQLLSRISTHIIVTHDYLAAQIDAPYRPKIILLPTTDGDMRHTDTDTLIAERLKTYDDTLRLAWLGTAGNLVFLSHIIPALDEAARRLSHDHGKRLRLDIVCNQPLNITTSHLNITNIDWTRDRALEALSHAHVGIMPLKTDNFTRGKAGFKLVQSLAAALPVVASAVGFNTEVVTPDCGYIIDDSTTTAPWTETIIALATDAQHYVSLSHGARQRYDQKFSYDHAKAVWHRLTQ